jgi:hypothetical protein
MTKAGAAASEKEKEREREREKEREARIEPTAEQPKHLSTDRGPEQASGGGGIGGGRQIDRFHTLYTRTKERKRATD